MSSFLSLFVLMPSLKGEDVFLSSLTLAEWEDGNTSLASHAKTKKDLDSETMKKEASYGNFASDQFVLVGFSLSHHIKLQLLDLLMTTQQNFDFSLPSSPSDDKQQYVALSRHFLALTPLKRIPYRTRASDFEYRDGPDLSDSL